MCVDCTRVDSECAALKFISCMFLSFALCGHVPVARFEWYHHSRGGGNRNKHCSSFFLSSSWRTAYVLTHVFVTKSLFWKRKEREKGKNSRIQMPYVSVALHKSRLYVWKSCVQTKRTHFRKHTFRKADRTQDRYVFLDWMRPDALWAQCDVGVVCQE